MSTAVIGPRVCVVGAGAIGGWIAARLALAAEQVSVLARGATLERIRGSGIELSSGGETRTAKVRASSNAEELGPQDIVVVAVKGQALPSLAASLKPLLHSNTVLLPAINGLPWWYFLPEDLPQSGLRLRCVDPQGDIERAFPLQNVVGISVFASSSSPQPGVVHHSAGKRLVFGEPMGGRSARVAELVARFTSAGFAGEESLNIRADIWNKLLGNASFNPVSFLTLGHTDDMIDDPGLHRLFVRMMTETLSVGDAIGLPVSMKPEDRIAVSRKLGHIRSSMLQDLDAGRSVEIEAILGALVECAEATGTAVPALDSVLALARGRASAMGL